MNARSIGARVGRTVVATAAVAMLVATAACGGNGGGADPAASSSTEASYPAQSPPDGGEVRVVDKGFSAGEQDGEPTVSYGVVVENTSAWVAYVAAVSVRMVDADGGTIEDTVSGSGGALVRDVRAIMPGEQAVLGNGTFVDRAGIADLEVGIEGVQWFPVENGVHEFAELTASDVVVTWEDGKATIDYTVNSGYAGELEKVWAEAVFRDAAGKIVGGTHPSGTVEGAHGPGASPGRIDAVGPLPPEGGVEVAVVYLYP